MPIPIRQDHHLNTRAPLGLELEGLPELAIRQGWQGWRWRWKGRRRYGEKWNIDWRWRWRKRRGMKGVLVGVISKG